MIECPEPLRITCADSSVLSVKRGLGGHRVRIQWTHPSGKYIAASLTHSEAREMAAALNAHADWIDGREDREIEAALQAALDSGAASTMDIDESDRACSFAKIAVRAALVGRDHG